MRHQPGTDKAASLAGSPVRNSIWYRGCTSKPLWSSSRLARVIHMKAISFPSHNATVNCSKARIKVLPYSFTSYNFKFSKPLKAQYQVFRRIEHVDPKWPHKDRDGEQVGGKPRWIPSQVPLNNFSIRSPDDKKTGLNTAAISPAGTYNAPQTDNSFKMWLRRGKKKMKQFQVHGLP